MTEIESMNNHAQEIYNKIISITDLIINSEPTPFYGGLPPLYVQLKNTLQYHGNDIKSNFNIVDGG